MKLFEKYKLNIVRFTGVFAIIAIALFGVSQVIIQAKYYQNKTENSKVSANGFYFSSDYLNEVQNGEIPEYIMAGMERQEKVLRLK